eukprot:2038472-Amphidinium_carterae.1
MYRHPNVDALVLQKCGIRSAACEPQRYENSGNELLETRNEVEVYQNSTSLVWLTEGRRRREDRRL